MLSGKSKVEDLWIDMWFWIQVFPKIASNELNIYIQYIYIAVLLGSCSAAQKQPTLVKRVWCRVRPSGGINTRSHIWFCSDPEPFTNDRCAQRLCLNFVEQNVDISLPIINLTAAATCGGDHWWVFMYCDVDYRLEPGGNELYLMNIIVYSKVIWLLGVNKH